MLFWGKVLYWVNIYELFSIINCNLFLKCACHSFNSFKKQILFNNLYYVGTFFTFVKKGITVGTCKPSGLIGPIKTSLTKALTYYYIKRSLCHLLAAIENNRWEGPKVRYAYGYNLYPCIPPVSQSVQLYIF